MRVLVVGGTGFLGRQLVPELLKAGHEVVVYHRGRHEVDFGREVRHLHGDRHELPALAARVAVDGVIDVNPMNDGDSQPVVAAFRGRIGRSVHLSSLDVYRAWAAVLDDAVAEPVPFSEEAPLRGSLYPYRDRYPGMESYEKILVERTVLGAGPAFPAAIVRLPVIYGPHDRQRREWAVLRRLLEGRPVIMGGGAAWLWQRMFVREAARAVVRVLESPEAVGRVFNAGEAATLTMRRWVEAIGRAAGVAAEIRVIPDDLLPPHLDLFRTRRQHIVGDTTLLRTTTGYREERSREEDLAESVAWHRDNPPREDEEAYRRQLELEDAALKIAGDRGR